MGTWKLTSDKFDGYILITYHNDWFVTLHIETKSPLKHEQYDWLFMHMRGNEFVLRRIGMKPFHIEPYLKAEKMAPNEKIALFCRMYSQYRNGLKYKADKRDGAMIAMHDISEALLDTYFQSQNFLFKDKYSIRNLLTYINEIRAEHAGVVKGPFPNYYCKELVDWLKGHEVKEYREHLAKIGIHISI